MTGIVKVFPSLSLDVATSEEQVSSGWDWGKEGCCTVETGRILCLAVLWLLSLLGLKSLFKCRCLAASLNCALLSLHVSCGMLLLFLLFVYFPCLRAVYSFEFLSEGIG